MAACSCVWLPCMSTRTIYRKSDTTRKSDPSGGVLEEVVPPSHPTERDEYFYWAHFVSMLELIREFFLNLWIRYFLALYFTVINEISSLFAETKPSINEILQQP